MKNERGKKFRAGTFFIIRFVKDLSKKKKALNVRLVKLISSVNLS